MFERFNSLKIKCSLLIIFAFIVNLSVLSQEDEVLRCMKEGEIAVDAYVGYPNWGVYNLNTYVSSPEINGSLKNTFGIVPIGLKGEIMLSEEISFTLDANYSRWGGEWDSEVTTYDGSMNPIVTKYENSYEASRFVFQIGANYHIPDLNSDVIDVYMGFSIGSNNINESVDVNHPEFNSRSQSYFLSNGFFGTSSTLAQTPISARVKAGARYFFRDDFGLNAELGAGVRTISFGLTYKL